MPRASELNEKERKLILELYDEKNSHREIAQKIGRSKTVVGNFLRDPANYAKRKRTGRKNKLTDCDTNAILLSTNNNKISSSDIKAGLNLNVSRWTINRIIHRKDTIIKEETIDCIDESTQIHSSLNVSNIENKNTNNTQIKFSVNSFTYILYQ